eukprot:TRINITY_DN24414_c0_g1_i1.p1 TRINITY_DN24414_c0_g1~~TRINITY_DN24414_c0_g1_i1.p1  ORF type:complete len:184 (-),score=29.17 TRINITY_DN24414_c0_g1_i1:232-783(-)
MYTNHSLLVSSKHMLDFFTSLPNILHFGKIACHFQTLWLDINTLIETRESKNYHAVIDAMRISKEVLLYIEDVASTVPELGEVASNALVFYAVYPLAMARLMEKEEIAYVKIDIALAMLNQIVSVIKYGPLLEAIAKPLTGSLIAAECKEAIEEFPEYVKGYSRVWKSYEYKNDIDCIGLHKC